MDKKRNKTILLNSLIFVFCVVIIILYCLVPPAKKPEVAKLQTYQVVFDTDGGTIISSVSVEEGHSIEAPPTPTKEGYIFDGWVVDDVSYDFSQIISGDVVLKARWREVAPDTVIYTVRFETEGGTTYPEQFIEENGKVVQPSEPVRDGYKFVEWQVDGNPYNFDNPVTSNLTIVAKWEEEDENKTYTVTFDLNGGNGSKPANQTVKTGESATVPSERPTHSNRYYIFNGWSTSRNAKSANIEAVKIRNDTTFYAVWQDTTPTWNVRIELNSSDARAGSNCSLNQSVTPGGHPSGCANVSRPGYKFTVWTYLGRTYKTLDAITIDSEPSNSNPIYAQWEKVETYTYTLTYNGGPGCTNYSTETTQSPYTYSSLCTPTAQAFKTFRGWALSNNSTSPVSSVTFDSSHKSYSLYALFDTKNYTVTCTHPIDSNSGQADTTSCRFGISPNDSGLHIEYTNENGKIRTINVGDEKDASFFLQYSYRVCNSNGACVDATRGNV
jgi:uncharacterized repeat protein (TIGR02543 family)